MMVIVGLATFTNIFFNIYRKHQHRELKHCSLNSERWRGAKEWTNYLDRVGCQTFMMSTKNLLGSSYLTFNFRLDVSFYYVFFFYNFLVAKETAKKKQTVYILCAKRKQNFIISSSIKCRLSIPFTKATIFFWLLLLLLRNRSRTTNDAKKSYAFLTVPHQFYRHNGL